MRITDGMSARTFIVCITLTIIGLLRATHALGCSSVPSPLGLPPLKSSQFSGERAEAISLGERLFFDQRLSADGAISCSSCHVPEKAFTDGRPTAQGVNSRIGTRNTPSLWNVVFVTDLFWDGRRTELERQALDPILNPGEHGLASSDTLLTVIHEDASYRKQFRRAYPNSDDAIRLEHVLAALASYERTLLAGNSAADRYLYNREENALSQSATRGLTLFRGRAQCVSCHLIGTHDALFTDGLFHSLGVGLNLLGQPLADATICAARTPAPELDAIISFRPEVAALGRFTVTKQPQDIGKFRTPSLRNVALTAPYMHDGSVASLEEAVEREVYYRNLKSNSPLVLTPREKSDLVAFLEALSSPLANQPRRNADAARFR